jgi:membrane-associated phospholipid phosphatase
MVTPLYTAAQLRMRGTGRAEPDGIARALCAAALCLVGLASTWIVAELVPAAQVKDAVALHDFTLLDTSHVEAAVNLLLAALDPLPFTIWGLALVLFALAGGHRRVALAVVLVLGLAPLSAELLKPLLAHPHVHIGAAHVGAASWPSGHSAAALALAMCAALVTPANLRRAVLVLGGVFAVAIGCAVLIRAWHMPSDVLGGYLLAALWMALAVAALRAAERRWPQACRGVSRLAFRSPGS